MSLFLSKKEEKPLTTCQKCKDQPCVKTGKICDKVEAMLPRPQGGTNGRKLRFYDPNVLESMANARAFRLKFGGRKQPNIEN